MIENFEIKIVRMKSGEDIICFCFQDYKNNRVILKYPKVFYNSFDVDLNESELILSDWMPQEAFALQEVFLPSDQILFITFSTVWFGIKYLQTLLEELDPNSTLSDQIQKYINKEESDLNELEELYSTNKTFH